MCRNLLNSTKSGTEYRPLFDIVAGSSIGAINAAVLVSNVVNRHKFWEEADYTSKSTDFTLDTVKKLIEQGQEDALKILEDK